VDVGRVSVLKFNGVHDPGVKLSEREAIAVFDDGDYPGAFTAPLAWGSWFC
jgi:hypothetical protein